MPELTVFQSKNRMFALRNQVTFATSDLPIHVIMREFKLVVTEKRAVVFLDGTKLIAHLRNFGLPQF